VKGCVIEIGAGTILGNEKSGTKLGITKQPSAVVCKRLEA
jgi:hypothetical protein